MKTYFRILTYIKPFGRYAVPYFIYAVLSIIFGLFTLTLLIPLLDILFNQVENQPPPASLPEFSISIAYIKEFFNYFFLNWVQDYGQKGTLTFVCIIVITCSFLGNLFKFLSQTVISHARASIIRNIRKGIFDKILDLHVGYFSNERKGDIITRLTSDVQEIEYSAISTLTIIFRDPISIVAFFIVLFSISVKLTLLTLLIFPITGVMIGIVSKKLKKESHEVQDSLGEILTITDESLVGARVIKAFNAQKYVGTKFDDENKRYANILRRVSNIRDLASPMSEVIGVAIVALILWIGGNLVLSGSAELKASQFIAYLGIFSQILVPAKGIAGAFSQLQRGLVSAERIFEVIDTPTTIVDKADAVELTKFENEIEFENVSFSYGKGDVLKNINLKIKKGSTVALVGASGGGKSTMADLIPRFYDATAGKVKIDGVDIKDYTLRSIRQHLGIVTQESILFNDTIFNNIAFGKPDAKEEDVIRAAKVANAHEFIVNTEKGYLTSIGDRGSKLSGGQRQRLSIARAVLRNPEILVLDEATSALDSESEKLVQSALINLMTNRTSVVIAHRLSTIQHADEIIVIQKGQIAERGSHAELMERDGIYRKLNLMQSV